MLHRKIAVGVCLLAGGLLAACGEEAAPGQRPPQTVGAVTLEAQRVTLRRELTGRITAHQVAEVRPLVGGIVRERLFVEGGEVELGQGLYRLVDDSYRAERDSAKAALQRAEARLAMLKLRAQRTGELVGSGAVSRQEDDEAQAEVAQAEADVAVAKAQLASQQLRVDYAHIRAPLSGRIGKSAVTAGALVTAGQSAPLAVIQQLDPVHVELTQSASELLELRRALAAGSVSAADELPVTLRFDDGSTYPHSGRLEFSELRVDPSTGSTLLQVVVPNPEQLLLPGMSMRAEVGRSVREQAILVPQRAVSRGARGDTSVLVVNGDGEVEQRAVELGVTVGQSWLVKSGLAAGDRVIVDGLQKVRPGAAVEVESVAPERPAADTAASADAS